MEYKLVQASVDSSVSRARSDDAWRCWVWCSICPALVLKISIINEMILL